jgi:hypothetical protein
MHARGGVRAAGSSRAADLGLRWVLLVLGPHKQRFGNVQFCLRDLRARIAIFRSCSLDERELAAWLLRRLTTLLNAGLLSHGVSRGAPFSAQCLPEQWVSHEAIMKAWKTGSDLPADRVCVPQLLLSSNRINRSVSRQFIHQARKFRLARVAKWQTQQTQNLPRLTLMSVRVRPRAPLFLL